MGRSLVVAVLALTGLLCAAGIGVATYLVSRSSVAVPVTRLQPKLRQSLTPAKVHPTRTATATTRTTPATPTPTPTPTPTATATVNDHGRSGGGDSSGHGGDD